jgi:hypothetical protein
MQYKYLLLDINGPAFYLKTTFQGLNFLSSSSSENFT